MPDSAASLTSFPVDLHAAFPADDLLAMVWDASSAPLVLLQPVWDEGGREVTDFTLALLNEAAQRMLGQPARPASTHTQLFPNLAANGGLDFYREVLATGQPGRRELKYPLDQLENYCWVSARRVGQGLLVSFTGPAPELGSAGELALRASQAREHAALAEAERQRTILLETFLQAPAMICILAGPQHVFELVNPLYQQAVGNRPLLGQPIREALPELAGQPVLGLLDQVYTTGETFRANEMPVQFDHAPCQELEMRYYNFIYQPRRDAREEVDAIIVLAYEVTEQVRAQQQAAESKRQATVANQELATANEELQATNEELRAANGDLFVTQLTLQELNQELEARVADRTSRLRSAQAEAERQRARLERFFMQAPAAICILDGPDLVFELVNPGYQALFPGRQLAGRPLLKALPELAGHAVWSSLHRVYETGATHYEEGILIPVARREGGRSKSFTSTTFSRRGTTRAGGLTASSFLPLR
ncbi:PAS domain-containing protein [Hymenobacter sp. BT664]|uniref:PAS domain-containing protein n=1 Tax=Hymenobacter montanus TaxID=2771359 RepID=A0A927BHK0_9BACT|nr:PAS domain-containing protein [Hymenobacter montanus]MBD2770174.1 PAS domain-containing protein [Hymenobacter montanus]